jgi:hypothetical protein
MPVSLPQLARIGTCSGSCRSVPVDGTRLAFLDDWIPVVSPLPWGSAVASPGDVLVASGVALFVAEGVASGAGARRRSRPRSGRP